MFANLFKVFTSMLSASVLSGCATKKLIDKDSVHTRDVHVNLVEDSVVAFSRPAQPVANLPANSLVIAGYINSDILTQGGTQFVNIINHLDLKNIQIMRELSFYSEKNDGYFRGTLPLAVCQITGRF